jgi:hypothetical protein
VSSAECRSQKRKRKRTTKKKTMTNKREEENNGREKKKIMKYEPPAGSIDSTKGSPIVAQREKVGSVSFEKNMLEFHI